VSQTRFALWSRARLSYCRIYRRKTKCFPLKRKAVTAVLNGLRELQAFQWIYAMRVQRQKPRVFRRWSHSLWVCDIVLKQHTCVGQNISLQWICFEFVAYKSNKQILCQASPRVIQVRNHKGWIPSIYLFHFMYFQLTIFQDKLVEDVHVKLNPGLPWQKLHSTRGRIFLPAHWT